ncbi:MAG TPA: pseudouridine synthase [Synergistaceae bacterium]|jgi:pseudouridine synthase|nr:pseudouridine synthase [Synergistaceae bacterium]
MTAMSGSDNSIRLNRYLAMCGIGARRKAEEHILAGKVSVNGEVVTEPGRQVGPSDTVTFEGKAVSPVEQKYLIFNKPRGVLCAVEDDREQTVIDILPTEMDRFRLFPVGRLDRDSEGLIILTNDGMFSQELIHPSKGIAKTYEVELRTPLPEDKLIEWTRGVEAEGLFLKPISVRRIGRRPLQCWFEVVLGEGIKREIRLMVRALGNDVRRLIRRKIGKLELRELESGSFISVGREELWSYIRNGKIV